MYNQMGNTMSKLAVVVGAVLVLFAVSFGFLKATGTGSAEYQNLSGLDAGAFQTLGVPSFPQETNTTTLDSGIDGGKNFDPTLRRDEFLGRMSAMAAGIGKRYEDKVEVEKVYFAKAFSEKADAAVVVFRAEKAKQTTVVVFVFQAVWQPLPVDFQ